MLGVTAAAETRLAASIEAPVEHQTAVESEVVAAELHNESDGGAAPLATATRSLMLWLCLLTAVRFGPTSLSQLLGRLSSPPQVEVAEFVFQIDVNTADVAELRTLEGIGPALAGRIIEYRTQHGPYQTIEELLNVKGFGEKRLQQLAPWLTVDLANSPGKESVQ